MEENNNLDAIFRSAAEQMEMKPSESTWDSISSRLDQKRAERNKKRRIILIMFSSLLLLVGLSSYYLLTNSNNQSPQNSTYSSSPKTLKQSPENHKIHPNFVSSNKNPTSAAQNNLTEGTASSNLYPTKSATSIQSVSETGKIKSSTKNSVQAKQIGVSNSKSRAVRSNATDNVSASSSPSATIKKRIKNEHTSSVSTTSLAYFKTATPSIIIDDTPVTHEPIASLHSNSGVSKIPSTEAIIRNKNTTTLKSAEPTVETSSTTSSVQEDVHSNLIPPNSIVKTSKTVRQSEAAVDSPLESSDRITSNSIGTPSELTNLYEQRLKKSNTPEQVNDKTNAPDLKRDSSNVKNSKGLASLAQKALSHLAIDLYYTPESALNRLRANSSYSGTASTSIADYNNQQPKYSYTGGFNARYGIGKGWSFTSGVSYSSYSSNSTYSSISVLSDSLYQRVYVNGPGGQYPEHHAGDHDQHGHPDPNHPNNPDENHHFLVHTNCGDFDLFNAPTNASGTSISNGDTLQIKTQTLQNLQMINIPIMVGYQFGHHRFSYFMEAGGSYTQIIKNTVSVVINDATAEDHSPSSFVKSIYMLNFGIGAQYNLYKGLSVFLKPSFRYSLKPINSDRPFNSYPYFFGIGGGISFQFK